MRIITLKLDQDALLFDMLWQVSLYLQPGRTPMWVGWNSKVILDSLPQQRVGYLSQINESPTHNHVVVETLRRSLEIANEVGMEYITVTYDLPIAKVAFSIQSEESPKFNRLC